MSDRIWKKIQGATCFRGWACQESCGQSHTMLRAGGLDCSHLAWGVPGSMGRLNKVLREHPSRHVAFAAAFEESEQLKNVFWQ